jgi:hypothetical protein
LSTRQKFIQPADLPIADAYPQGASHGVSSDNRASSIDRLDSRFHGNPFQRETGPPGRNQELGSAQCPLSSQRHSLSFRSWTQRRMPRPDGEHTCVLSAKSSCMMQAVGKMENTSSFCGSKLDRASLVDY